MSKLSRHKFKNQFALNDYVMNYIENVRWENSTLKIQHHGQDHPKFIRLRRDGSSDLLGVDGDNLFQFMSEILEQNVARGLMIQQTSYAVDPQANTGKASLVSSKTGSAASC